MQMMGGYLRPCKELVQRHLCRSRLDDLELEDMQGVHEAYHAGKHRSLWHHEVVQRHAEIHVLRADVPDPSCQLPAERQGRTQHMLAACLALLSWQKCHE